MPRITRSKLNPTSTPPAGLVAGQHADRMRRFVRRSEMPGVEPPRDAADYARWAKVVRRSAQRTSPR